LMGLAHLQDIASALIERGWSAATPVAVLFSASRDDASVWTTTLGDVESGREQPDADGEAGARPGTIVIGDVVRIRGLIAPSVDMPAHAIARHG
jgi:siroheme synthase